ncbi:MAG: RNA methyltransferase [Nitratireductor sp.]|nr:RNA methyltransferase [Nitratireductor sp.]
MSETLRIERLGRQGDGIAEDGSFVSFALPSETVTVSGSGERRKLEAVTLPSPQRVAPLCRHFGTCGGCQMQHLAFDQYLEWKRGLVTEALVREGIDTEVKPIVSFGAHQRRRVIFTAIRAEGRMLLGFSQKQTNRITDLAQCPVLLPQIEGRLAEFRELCGILAPKKGTMKLTVLACDNGLDIAASNGGFTPEKARQAAIAFAGQKGFLRLSLNGETLIEFSRPLLTIGKAQVSPPPEGFVQAVAGAEEAMARLAMAHLAGARHVADLFSGFGAFALRLAEHSIVHAADSSGAAIAALDRAWRETGGALKALKAERRDLYRRPLMADELAKTDGVVFDPPRAGAEEQARELARSKVARIVAISCNPVTLARDLRILADGGYRVKSVTPIDQFVFTPHVEAVAEVER